MSVAIILVEPQMGENIGASARAMKNFGITDLRIVSPRDGWPNQRAQIMSAHAIDVVNNAKIYESLSDSIADLFFVYAATGTPRDINKNYILSRNLAKDIPNTNIGIMFGRESSGLTNEEISYANKILVIDADQNFPSLNIAQAVCVVCYELFGANLKERNDINNIQQIASMDSMNHFYEHLFRKLDEQNFFRVPEKKEYMVQKIRNLFGRIDKLSNQEVQILHGILSLISDLNQNKKM